MSGSNRVVWSEGMFLQPQHFQQHDRFIENYIKGRCFGLRPFDWGFYFLTIDQAQLGMGKLTLLSCRGIMPDGTPFHLPEDDPLPLSIEIPEDANNELIYLAVPLSQSGNTEVSDASSTTMARYHLDEFEVKDSNENSQSKSVVQIGTLRSSLMLESQERSGFACLGVAKVVEMRADKTVILDEAFIRPTLNCQTTPTLLGLIKELRGLLHTRSEALAGRVSEAGRGGAAEIADFLLLQLVNCYEPLFEHLAGLSGYHPQDLYENTIQLAGELATFTHADKRAPSFSIYRHDDLQKTFEPVMEELRKSLSTVLEQNAIPIPLTKPKYGVYAAKIPDRHLLDSAIFILAAHADVSPDLLRSRFPTQIKIGPAEIIQRLVQSALPGISVVPLPVAPRQIPYHAGFSYFELSKQGELWTGMKKSGGFAIHIAGDFPGLKLEFWAIKSG